MDVALLWSQVLNRESSGILLQMVFVCFSSPPSIRLQAEQHVLMWHMNNILTYDVPIIVV